MRYRRFYRDDNIYVFGLDVLGAVPRGGITSKATSSAAGADPQVAAAGNRAISSGGRFIGRAATMGRKLAAIGKRAIEKSAAANAAKAADKAAAAAKTAARASAAAKSGAGAGAETRTAAAAPAAARTSVSSPSSAHTAAAATTRTAVTAPTRRTSSATSRTAVRGSVVGVVPMAAASDYSAALAVQTLTSMAEAANGILSLADQLTAAGRSDAANSGYGIFDRAKRIIDNLDVDTSYLEYDTGAMNSVKSAAEMWSVQAQAILTGADVSPTAAGPAPFDPGSAGGGAGGGDSGGGAEGGEEGAPGEDPGAGGGAAEEGFDETPSSSEEVQRFRESGGEYDPFADEGDAVPGGAGEVDPFAEGAVDEEDPFANVSDEEAAAVAETMLGMEFKWQYLFLPHMAIQDAIEERTHTPGTPMALATNETQGKGPPPSSDVAQRLSASQKKLADAKRRQAMTQSLQSRQAAAFRKSQDISSTPAAENPDVEVLGLDYTRGLDVLGAFHTIGGLREPSRPRRDSSGLNMLGAFHNLRGCYRG